ncbi:MAG TPA: hypothetical protein VLI90_05425 [Tepidisphaeraceae bacterium]|nr:hypothetical protein [Tepidisphaeraceae bacterium]
MAQPDPDELADALSKLAGGEIAPSEQEPPAPIQQPQAQPARSPAPSAAKPAAKPAARPAAAGAARPQRPTTPAPRPAAPTKAEPLPPSVSAPAETPLDVNLSSEAGMVLPPEQPEIIDDDDSVNIPAPDATVFAPRPRTRPALRTGRSVIYQTIEFRRTIIPILLTCGTLVILFGSLKYTLGPDSALAELPSWLPVVLFITGAVLIALAVVNMLSVKHQLADVKK